VPPLLVASRSRCSCTRLGVIDVDALPWITRILLYLERSKSEERMTKKESQFPAKKAKTAAKMRPRRKVQVVQCPSDFPTSSSSASSDGGHLFQRRDSRQRDDKDDNKEELLDWNDTTRQVRAFASTAFLGKTKRQYKQEEYERLTGRKLKNQRVPQHIVRGIKKKRKERMEKHVEEAKLNGIILPTTLSKKKEKKHDDNRNQDGPAPSIGYMKQGVFRIKTGNKKQRR